eukprot:gene4350-1018_t
MAASASVCRIGAGFNLNATQIMLQAIVEEKGWPEGKEEYQLGRTHTWEMMRLSGFKEKDKKAGKVPRPKEEVQRLRDAMKCRVAFMVKKHNLIPVLVG